LIDAEPVTFGVSGTPNPAGMPVMALLVRNLVWV
jgi:hypothetical protein